MAKHALVSPSGEFRFRVVCDTREQLPYTFENIPRDAQDGGMPGDVLTIPTVRKTLKSGDYSIEGFEDRVSIDRKSLADLYSTIASGRDRFERLMGRLAKLKFGAVVVEADESEAYRSPPGKLVWSGWAKSKEHAVEKFTFGDTLSVDSLKWLDGARFRLGDDTTYKVSISDLETNMVGEFAASIDRLYSGLSPKTVARSVDVWRTRFGVHFVFIGPRRMAEIKTFRILERFAKDNEPNDLKAGPATS